MKKNKVQKFITAFVLGSVMLSVPLLTAYASVSQNVNIKFQHEVVNGAKNGKYHKLKKGYANLKLIVSAEGKSATPVTITLKKERFGFDSSYGTRTFIPGKSYTGKTTTHQYYVDGDSSQYYLIASKSNRYYWITANGTLKNK
ncbi:hypothetical protein HCJ66_02890 [Listeria sp. FSL L7-1582]|uniref:hypothetical protein n=1 Tax=Listeria portnoyi TaxID=2713504 RepID=UPI00164D6B39|nr:hypothetical protein [Listeria portnoyi]MBC6308494.1 hypothetical protein [Listeria portnoyi]